MQRVFLYLVYINKPSKEELWQHKKNLKVQ